jgi:hypothetical protein
LYKPPNGKYNYVGGIKNTEACGLLNLLDPKSPIGLITQNFKKLSRDLIHPCPYLVGHFELKNVSTSTKDYFVLRKGQYKLSVFARDPEIDPDGFNLTMFYTFIVRGGELL